MRKFMKKFTSGILAAAMVASLVSVAPSVKVEAEDVDWDNTGLVVNGDFETVDLSDWVINDDANVKSEAAGEWNKNNKTTHLHVQNYTGAALELSIEQKIDGVPAGTYKVGLDYSGEGKSLFDITVNDDLATGKTSEPSGWDQWSQAETGSFTIEKATDITIKISSTMVDSSYVDFDNVILYKAPAYSYKDSGLVVNGDFETVDLSDWVINDDANVKSEAAGEWNKNNKTTHLHVQNYTGAALELSIEQKIDGVPAGTYKVGLDYSGEGKSLFDITVNDDLATGKTSEPSGWDQWSQAETGSFTIEKATDITIKISSIMVNSSYVDFDNVVLYTYTKDDDESDEIKTLKSLMSVAKTYKTDSCTTASSEKLKEAISSAQTVVNAGASAQDEEIQLAYDTIVAAIEGLAKDVTRVCDYVSEIDYGDTDDVIIMPVENVKEDTIRGIDVSSYISIMNAFDYLNAQNPNGNYGFKDAEGNLLTRQGFFDYLASQGVNYIRVRVWNDPYNSVMTDKGYGGGDNDAAKAIEIGEYATEAGMKLLVDFHFSDSWTDPGKQREPKAWKDYTLDEKAEAIADFTTEVLTAMKDKNIDVGMVQIGNETNGKFCGETSWENMNKLFDAGCDAVHKVDSKIKAVLHFTDIQTAGKQIGYAKSLNEYDGDGDGTNEGVSYDVFATSYYPYWHGSLDNLTEVLNTIATTYNKEVMVAETSYANTMLDTDGHTNTVRVGTNDTGSNLLWDMNVQGQASEVRAVIDAVTQVSGDKGLGVFYWEGAWITLQNTNVEDDSEYTALVQSNRALWEKYGAGWASSAASEYGTDEAEFYGGSAVDNQAFFDADGNPLPSIKAFNYEYLKNGYGATELTVTGYDQLSYTIEVGNTLQASDMPKGQATYSNAEKQQFDIEWSKDDISKINELAVSDANAGDYDVSGKATVNGEEIIQTCTVTIAPKNQLINGDFQKYGTNKWDNWETSGTGCNTTDMGTNSRNDSGGSVHYYNANAFEFNVYQNVDVTDVTSFIPGDYEAYCYFEGADSYVDISVTVGDKTYSSEPVKSGGWSTWLKVEIKDIDLSYETIKDIDSIKFNIHCTGAAGAYGGIDDAHLCMTKVDPAYTQALKDAGVVDERIEKIGDATLDSETAISDIRKSYSTLSELAKKLVTKLDVLDAAENEVDLLKKASAVDTKIAAIGKVTSLDQKTAVDEARKAYDSLSADAKARVKNESVLKAAEEAIAKLEKDKADADEAAAKVEADNAAAASDAELYIDVIGTVTTLSSKATVEYARKVYDSLTDEQKALVKNYDKLVAAEKVIKELVFESTPADKDERITEAATDAQYKVTKVPEYDGAVGTVTYIAPTDKTVKNVTIPATITYHGVKYKVTAIADNAFKGNTKVKSVTIGSNVSKIGKKAFYNCKNLKKITIKTSKLTTSKVGANAFKNVKKTVTVKVPAKKLKAYKKLLKKKGLTSKAKIKK